MIPSGNETLCLDTDTARPPGKFAVQMIFQGDILPRSGTDGPSENIVRHPCVGIGELGVGVFAELWRRSTYPACLIVIVLVNKISKLGLGEEGGG